MKRYLVLISVLCSLLGLSAPATAQVVLHDGSQFNEGLEARIGLSIPFGGNYKNAASKPQFALSLRSENSRNLRQDWPLRPPASMREVPELKIALTAERAPSLLFNDQFLMNFGEDVHADDERLGALDKYDKVILGVIGISLAVIATSIIVIAE